MPLIVNGEKIEDSLIDDEMNRMRQQYQATFTEQTREEQEKQLRQWAQENVIERTLLQQAARKDPTPVSPAELETAWNKIMDEQGGEQQFLQNCGLTPADMEQLRNNVELQIRVDRFIENLCRDLSKPTEQQLKAFYDENIQNFTTPEMVRAAHIVKHVDANTSPDQAKQAILEIQKELKSGRRFEELADGNSDCPGNGGDLGFFRRGEMVPRFEKVAFSLQENEVSDIVQTEYGFHIVKVYEKKTAEASPFEQVKDKIFNHIYEQDRNTTVEQFLDEQRAKADVGELFSEKAATPANDKQNQHHASAQHEKTASKFRKRLSSVLVKPAGPDCNMGCDYCFYLKKADLFSETKVHRMSVEILEEMVRQIMESAGPRVSFGWQGGEPTLMGLPFFKKTVEFQQHYGKGQTVGNGLQTNGILIDNDWAKFLKQYNFLVGLSLDGPEHVHDRYRLMQSGKGSWQKVMDSARLMLDEGVAVNALSVVNDYSVQFPEEIYQFHKELGLTFQQYIPCVETDPADTSKHAPFSVSPEKFGKFLCTMFDLWINDFKDDVPTTSIRYFESLFHSYVGMPAPECTLLPQCGIYVVVEHDGGVYACDFFVDPEWKLGNIMDGNIGDFLNSERQLQFGRTKSTLPELCKTCKWLRYCYGGCPKDRIRDPHDNNISHFCGSYKMFFEHADQRMRNLADRWQQEQIRLSQQQATARSIKSSAKSVGRNDPCPCGSGKKYKKCCGRG